MARTVYLKNGETRMTFSPYERHILIENLLEEYCGDDAVVMFNDIVDELVEQIKDLKGTITDLEKEIDRLEMGE